MLWRGSARLGGVSGVDFNVLGNPAELVRKLKMNADIAVFVNLDSTTSQSKSISCLIATAICQSFVISRPPHNIALQRVYHLPVLLGFPRLNLQLHILRHQSIDLCLCALAHIVFRWWNYRLARLVKNIPLNKGRLLSAYPFRCSILI